MQSRNQRRMRRIGRLTGAALLAMATTGAAVSLAGSTSALAAAQHSVQITNGGSCGGYFCFAPASLGAGSGDTVTWTNSSSTGHIIARCDATNCSGQGPGTGGDSLGSSTIGSGSSFSHTFSSSGTYLYYCAIHGYAVMHGQVTVSGTPPPPPPTPRPTPRPTPKPTPPPAPHMSASAVAPKTTPPPPPASPAATATPAPLAVTLPSSSATNSPQSTASTVLGSPVGATGTTTGGTPVVGIVAVLVVAGMAAGYLIWRRRSPTP